MKETISDTEDYKLYNDPLKLFSAMTDDIKQAEKTIFLQSYKFSNDFIGQKFRDELTKKAKKGVEIYVLIDSWGAGVSESFFAELIKYGGKVKFFEKIKLSLDIFSVNHRRNHRKLLIIDSKISYIGSANITAYCLNWRECTVRISGQIATKFEKFFKSDFEISNKLYQNKRLSTRLARYKDVEIIRDVPGNIQQPVRKKYLKMIRAAKEEIVIETPYFLPGTSLRRSLYLAVKRGVNVKILTPMHSDVMLFDILRNKYFGQLFKKGVEVLQFQPGNLHSKIILVDKKSFFMGSSNFDYRSFRYMHEINIAGENPQISALLSKHVNETISECSNFDYMKWKKRHFLLKIVEWLLVPVRHLF
jgi:cardiolipin synthase